MSGGVLGRGGALCLVKDMTCHRDGNVVVVSSFLVAVGQFSPCGSAKLAVLAT